MYKYEIIIGACVLTAVKGMQCSTITALSVV